MSFLQALSYSGLNSFILTPIDLIRQWMGMEVMKAPNSRLSTLFYVVDKCKTVLDGLAFFPWSETVWNRDSDRRCYITEDNEIVRGKVRDVLNGAHHIVEQGYIWAIWLNEASNCLRWLKEEKLVQIESTDVNKILDIYHAATSTFIAIFHLSLLPFESQFIKEHRHAPRDWARWLLDDITPIISRLALVYLSFYTTERAKTWQLYWNTAWCVANASSFLMSLSARKN
jgi:hypothetical protein